jgi:nitroreductase
MTKKDLYRNMTATLNDQFTAIATARHSTRAFLDRPVAREVLAHVLTVAAHAPSTRNGQPWQVEVVTGAARDELAARLCEAFDRGVPPAPDYRNRPDHPDEVTEQRARDAGAGLLAAAGIDRADQAARRAHLRNNLEFHGAPVAMLLHLRSDAPPGTFLELGLFLQNVMLGLVSCGLGSCPQYSVAGYPQVIRQVLGLGEDRLVVCALAVGHPDPGAPVNTFAPERAGLAEYTRWHDRAGHQACPALTG